MKHIRYIITGERFTGELEFRYDATGIVYFEDRTLMDAKQRSFLFDKFPYTLTRLMDLCKNSTTLKLVKLSVTIEFNVFYDAYAYKVGNKKRAEKLWLDLQDSDKVLAIEHIKRYNAYLNARPQMEKLYPETYLSQRRWLNVLP